MAAKEQELKALYDIILNDAETGDTTIIKAGETVDAKTHADKIDEWSRRHLLITAGDEALIERLKATGAAEASYDYNPVIDLRGQAEEAAAQAAADAAQAAAQQAAQKVVADAKAAEDAKAAADAKAAEDSKKGK